MSSLIISRHERQVPLFSDTQHVGEPASIFKVLSLRACHQAWKAGFDFVSQFSRRILPGIIPAKVFIAGVAGGMFCILDIGTRYIDPGLTIPLQVVEYRELTAPVCAGWRH